MVIALAIETFMNSISIEELEQKIDAGEEVIDRYFDATTIRVGTPHKMIPRRQQNLVTTNVETNKLPLMESS